MLPGPYERWFVELSGRPGPVEARSTCERCAMLPDAPELPPEGPFNPVTRCCTYHPLLAPHLVGGILASGTEQGRALVRTRIAARVGVSPLGLGPGPGYAALYARLASEPGAFGRRRELDCPFHRDDRCTIWQHRGMACAAFHCKHDRGALSASLWSTLVIGFHHLERALNRWLLARQGLEVAACDALLHAPEDEAKDARAWAHWRGREEEYFVEAARLVEALSWSEALALGPPSLAGLTDLLRTALARLDTAPPERVQRNGAILYRLGRTGSRGELLTVRLQNPELPLELLEVPKALADQLTALQPGPLAAMGLEPLLARKLLELPALLPA